MTKVLKIAIDLMGGDKAPNMPIEAIAKFLKHNPNENVKFLLFGDEIIIKNLTKKIDSQFYEIIHCEKKIASDEKPSTALRNSKDSSMREAIQCVANKKADACISAGNTGALMALSKIILGMIEGITRPAICGTIPAGMNNKAVLLDMGANIDIDAKILYEFAMMGNAYAKAILCKENPTISFLNIGSEDIKGHQYIKDAAEMMKNSSLNKQFIGNIEPNDLFHENKSDVVVADGFIGNITIKSAEGFGALIKMILKDSFLNSMLTKTGYLMVKRALKKKMSKIDPNNYNGAMLLGLNGISVKAHGSSSVHGFEMAIQNTLLLTKEDINTKIFSYLKK